MKRKIIIVSTLASLLAAGFGATACNRGYSGPVATLSIGFQENEGAAEIYVAIEKGYFSNNGLYVTVKGYENGAAAIKGVLSGEVNIAGATETALVDNAFAQQPVTTIGCSNKLDVMLLIWRTDRGIQKIADLNGKRIGIASTSGKFFFGRFLDLNGMSISKVTVVEIPASQAAAALSEGTIDAVVAAEPVLFNLLNKPDPNLVTWRIQQSQPIYGLFIATTAWLGDHQESTARFLRALDQANEYIAQHPAEVKAMIKNRFDYTDEYLAAVWPEHRFGLFLDQSLILAMEDQARFLIQNRVTTVISVPDFLGFINEGALKKLKPDAVRIIR